MTRTLIALLMLTATAQAQHDHAQGHVHYKNWMNMAGRGCCNNQDCGTLKESDERTTQNGLEVRIEGQWCLVKPHHYLKTGNAPDWSTAHVCVLKAAPWHIISVCDRLLCYQPKPSF